VSPFYNSDKDGSVTARKYNLTDRSLPLYYIIKNVIRLTSALDGWEDAEVYRLTAARNMHMKPDVRIYTL
jgi:hypothetical protein